MAEYIIDKIAYGGDVYKLQDNQSGYITGYTETDPVFSASAAAGISATDISNWNAKSDTDEKMKWTASTSSNTYYPLVSTSTATTSTSNTLNGINFYQYYSIYGGYRRLTLGNSTHFTSSGGAYGTIRLYGTGQTYYGELNPGTSNIDGISLTANRTWTLPDATGTIALTSDIPTITLNGSSSSSPSFYAPTTAGTSGQVLTSNGSGAPTWAATPSGGGDIFIATYDVTTIEQVRAAYQAGKYIICRSPSDFSAQGWYSLAEREIVYDVDETTIFGETYIFRYVSGYSGSNTSRVELWYIALDKDGGWYYNNTNLNIPKITLNGSTTTSPNFYAPTTAGTSGQVLTSNGSGAPTWAAATGGTDEKLALSEVTSGTIYYPIMGTGTTAATRQYDTGGLSYINDGGIKRLSIGDNTSNNNLGMLDIYSLTSSRVRLAASTSLSSNVLVYLPSTAGTIALTSDISKTQIIRWTES